MKIFIDPNDETKKCPFFFNKLTSQSIKSRKLHSPFLLLVIHRHCDYEISF